MTFDFSYLHYFVVFPFPFSFTGEFEISNRKLSIKEAKRNVNHAIKVYNEKRPHWSCHFLTPQQAHEKGEFKLRKWSKFKFSNN